MRKHLIPPTWLIILVVLLYSGLFVLSVHNPGNSVKGDSYGYLQLASNLRYHHFFSSDIVPPYSPELFRLPVYPLFLAVLHGTDPSRIRLTIGVQCLLGIGLLFMVWPHLHRLGGSRGATLGAVFLSCDLILLLHQNLIMTEALFTFVLTATVCLSIGYLEAPSLPRAFAAGISYGITALIKPIAFFAAGAFLLSAFKKWRRILPLSFFIFGLPLLWMLRNWVAVGRLVYTVQGGNALYQYPAASALAMDTGRSRQEALQDLDQIAEKQGLVKGMDPAAQNLVYQRIAIHVMKQHPTATLKYCAQGIVRILGGTGLEMILDLLRRPRPETPQQVPDTAMAGEGTLSLLRAHPVLIPVQLSYMAFLLGGYILFGMGVSNLIHQSQGRLALFLALSVFTILFISCHQGYYRFRIPLLPFLAFGIAAIFYNHSDQWKPPKKSP